MECPSPSANKQFLKNNVKSYRKRRRHTTNGKYMDSYMTLKIGFIMDNVAAVRDLEKHLKVLQSQIVYVQDPKYFEFSNTIKSYKGDTLVIEVSNTTFIKCLYFYLLCITYYYAKPYYLTSLFKSIVLIILYLFSKFFLLF